MGKKLAFQPQSAPDYPATDLRKSLDGLRPWGVSAVLHLIGLVLLGLWTIPILEQGTILIEAWQKSGDESDSVEFELATSENNTLDADSPSSSAFTVEFQPENIAVPEFELDETFALNRVTLDTANAIESSESSSVLDVLDGAETVEEAVDRVTGGIRGKLENGDLLVVWLLDASISLVDDRQRVAERLESFFAQLDSRNNTLLNAVVSFGKNMRERIAPTSSVGLVVSSVKELPIDASGRENVFTAIKKSVARYRSKWTKQLMIVVWTDESGDDAVQLENTIVVCNKSRVSVSVVGPSAILGAGEAFHAYTDPRTQIQYQLPITRGPDSALDQRLRLDYWFWTWPPGDGQIRRRFAQTVLYEQPALPAWYGGRDLGAITSGFGPYALTRLAQNTGGAYTIFDRPEDHGPYDASHMRAYLPDYRPAKQQLQEIQSKPLRRAVDEVVRLTRVNPSFQTPPLALFGRRSAIPPHPFEREFHQPLQFMKKLKSSSTRLLNNVQRMQTATEKALALISNNGNPEKGMDYEYEQEQNPRWRAWYDLTRGRLLATSVRLEEYRLLCDEFRSPEFLRDRTNHLILIPNNAMKAGTKFVARAEEAKRLLRRCVADNRETPWEYLAQRDLDHEMGIAIQQVVLHPVTGSKVTVPELPKF